jgi:DNA-binding PadR family transcriptional regulator
VGVTDDVEDVRRGVDDPPSRQTIYRVLDQLAEDDWLIRDGKYWVPDLKAEMLGDVDEEPDRGGISFDADDLL